MKAFFLNLPEQIIAKFSLFVHINFKPLRNPLQTCFNSIMTLSQIYHDSVPNLSQTIINLFANSRPNPLHPFQADYPPICLQTGVYFASKIWHRMCSIKIAESSKSGVFENETSTQSFKVRRRHGKGPKHTICPKHLQPL